VPLAHTVCVTAPNEKVILPLLWLRVHSLQWDWSVVVVHPLYGSMGRASDWDRLHPYGSSTRRPTGLNTRGLTGAGPVSGRSGPLPLTEAA